MFFSLLMTPTLSNAQCTPSAAKVCANADDLITLYLNGNNAGTFGYVGTYDTAAISCNTVSTSFLNTSGTNYISVLNESTAAQQMWATWSLDITCSNGQHVYVTDTSSAVSVFDENDPASCAVTAPPGTGGNWYSSTFVPTGWTVASTVSGTLWGKQVPGSANRRSYFAYFLQ